MVNSIEGMIGQYVLQTLGNNWDLVALVAIFVWGAFVAVMRVPAVVAIISTGLFILLFVGGQILNTNVYGTLQANGVLNGNYLLFIVAIVAAVGLYLGLKTTIWRDY